MRGGPYWNRTNNLLIKSQVLCLVELTALEDVQKPGFGYQRASRLSIVFSSVNAATGAFPFDAGPWVCGP